ncbi:hypothetical protein N658DRAFT_349194 [Parathielavia hyrcaniae]|uniref:Secreted protein n=1 Tax=Parathielavia hyrcaniae TaxID=113614 RepID=A0AAN6SX12_9PEZI|nr:hypothetical protein N658DRAFT_349194 [Parathielavia hyrcaniae]
MVPVWFWAALWTLRTAARRSCPVPLAVPFFSGFARATNPSTIFLIASMSVGGGESLTVGGSGSWLVRAPAKVFSGRLRHLESLYFPHPLRPRNKLRGRASGALRYGFSRAPERYSKFKAGYTVDLTTESS